MSRTSGSVPVFKNPNAIGGKRILFFMRNFLEDLGSRRTEQNIKQSNSPKSTSPEFDSAPRPTQMGIDVIGKMSAGVIQFLALSLVKNYERSNLSNLSCHVGKEKGKNNG